MREILACVLHMDNCPCLFSGVWSCGNIFSFRNNTVQKELRDWNLELEGGFLSFSGRTLQDVRIHQGRRMVRASELSCQSWVKLVTTQSGTNLVVSITLFRLPVLSL